MLRYGASARPATSLVPSVRVRVFAVFSADGVQVERSPWLFQLTFMPARSTNTKRSGVTKTKRASVGSMASADTTAARGHGCAWVGSIW